MFASEPWGKWIQVNPTGEILNPEAAAIRHVTAFGQLTVAEAGAMSNDKSRSTIRLNTPRQLQDTCGLEIRLTGLDGQVLTSVNGGGSVGRDEVGEVYKLSPDQFLRFEYRLRPFQHLVKFENVSLNLKKPT